MVFKKYIKRDGKVYGPYLYYNVKKDGRVITHYLGKHETIHKHNLFSKKFLFVFGFLALLIIVLSINLFFLLNLGFTGKAAIEIQDTYQEGEPLSGNINLVLKHGELFPADSKLVIDNVGEISEYNIKDLISEQSSEGDFYLENKERAGSGPGYGVLGEKTIYPSVSFSFKIVDIVIGGEEPGITEPPSEETPTIPNETPSETPTTEIPTETIPNTTTEETPTIPNETTPETPATPESTTETPTETIPTTPGAEETPSTPAEVSTESSSTTESGTPKTRSEPSITGEIVGEGESLIEAETSKETPFVYESPEGKTIEIVSSVHPVNLVKEGNKISVVTDYSETEKGFGGDYLTNELIKIPISISNLNLTAKSGELKVSFVYNDVELVSSTKKINVAEVTLPEINITNITEINVTAQNITNITREQMIGEIISTKGFKIDSQVVSKLIESDKKIRVIVKTKKGMSSVGTKLGNLDFEVMELDSETLALMGNEVLEIVEDQPVGMFLSDSENIIRSLSARNEFSLTGAGKKICVIDTGVDSSVITNYKDGWDFVNNGPNPDDDNGHGTKVAYIVQTIAPGADIFVAKVIDANGIGYESDVLQGLQWCIDQNVDIISFSIGSRSYDGFCDANFVAELANSAVSQSIFVVAAIGNDNSINMACPSCGSKVLRASATDKSDNIAGFSNVNLVTDVFAPGVSINVKGIGGAAESVSGTSASAPMVSASASLILENETLSPEELAFRLKTTGKPILYSQGGEDINISRIDVYNAIINNVTMGVSNFTMNQSNVSNMSIEYGLFNTIYRVYGLPTIVQGAHPPLPNPNCIQIGGDITVNETNILFGMARINVSKTATPACYLRVCNASLSNCTLFDVTPESKDYGVSNWFNASVSPNYTVSNANKYSYKLFVCANGCGVACYCKASWAELNVTGRTYYFDINLTSPQDNYIPFSNSTTFQCNVSSAYPLSTVVLWGNWSGGWGTKSSYGQGPGIYDVLVEFNVPNIPNGIYSWNCNAVDTSGRSNFSQSNRTFTVDPCLPPTDNDWNISQSCVVSGKNFVLAQDKNLNILNNGSLKLINTNLSISPFAGNGSSNIIIYSGGALNITSTSWVRVISGQNRFGFYGQSGANFSMTNSKIENVGWADVGGGRGIELNTPLKEFSGNTINNSYYALYLLAGNNTILFNNFTNLITGLALFDSNNNVSWNKIYYYQEGIIFSTNSFYNSVIGNNISNGNRGIHLIGYYSNGFSNFSDNFIYNNSGAGIRVTNFGRFYNYTFLRNTIINNNEGVDFGCVGTPRPSNNSFIDCVIENNTVYDFVNNGENNIFLNTTFNRSKISVPDGYMNVYWYLDAKVSDISNSTWQDINGALVEGYNQSNALYFNATTNSSGFIQRQIVKDFYENSTQRFSWNPYTINASWQGRINSTQVNINRSMFLNISLDFCDFSSASVMNISTSLTCTNKVIIMSKTSTLNILPTGNLTFNNVTLVTGNTTVYNGGKFRVFNSPTTIWQNGNLNISGEFVLDNSTLRMNGTASNNGSASIFVNSGGNMTIRNNSLISNGNDTGYRFNFRVNGSFSMENSTLQYCGWNSFNYFSVSTPVSIFKGNSIVLNYKIYFSSNGNAIENNIFSNLTTSGLIIDGQKNNISNNLFFGIYGRAVDVGSNGNIINNNIIKSSITGLHFVSSASNNSVFNNTITYSLIGGYGVEIWGPNNTILGSNISLNYGAGIGIGQSPDGTLIRDSVVSGNVYNDIEVIPLSSPSTITFLNTSFNKSSVSWNGDTNGKLVVKWYFNVNVTNTTGAPIQAMTVRATNVTGNTVFNIVTSPYGNLTNAQNLTEYYENGTQKYFATNYTINVTRIDNYYYPYSIQLNLTQSTILNVILNARPVVSNVILNSSSGRNSTIENLSVYYNSLDADLDNLTNITDWRVNGTSIAVLNMPFNTKVETVNLGAIKDYSTFGNNGTIGQGPKGPIGPVWTSGGRSGGAYAFDGFDDWINISNNPSLNLTKTLTVSIWIKPAKVHENGTNYGVMAKALSTEDPPWSWQLRFGGEDLPTCDTNTLGFQFNRDGTTTNSVWVNIDGNLTIGQWYHLVGTYNGTHVSIYLNGVLNETKLLDLIYSSDTPILIGNEGWPGNYFNGTIDEVLIFNRSLSSQQIFDLYQAGLANKSLEKIRSQELKVGENWSVMVTPNDAYGDGNTILSNGVLIVNEPPIPRTVSLNPSTAYTNSTMRCEFNVTDAESQNLNVSVLWYRDSIKILTQNITGYAAGTNFTANLSSDMTYHDNIVFCNISATDGSASSGWNISNSVTIQNYTTSLTIFNETGKRANESVKFNASYASSKIGNIGRVVWSYGDYFVYNGSKAVRFADLDNNGFKDEVVTAGATGTWGQGIVQSFYSNGTPYWSKTGSYQGMTFEFAVGDIDHDGYENDIVVGYAGRVERYFFNGTSVWTIVNNGDSNAIAVFVNLTEDPYLEIINPQSGISSGSYYAYNSTGNQIWNTTGVCRNAEEVHVGDLDRGGKNNDPVFFDHNICGGGFASFVAFNESGKLLFNTTSLGSSLFSNGVTLDLNNDGYEDEILVAINSKIRGFRFNGTYGATFTDAQSIYNINNLGNNIYELARADLDLDGYEDDIVFADNTNIYGYDNNAAMLWSYPLSGKLIYSIRIFDINDDASEEILAGTNSSDLIVLNRTGGLIWGSTLQGYGSIGFTSGSGQGIDSADANQDGVNELAAVYSMDYIYVYQDSNCKIRFNDSVSADMVWNSSSSAWEYNRNFSNYGIYSYNISCAKGGYDTGTQSGSVDIPQNNLPTVELVSPPDNNQTTNRTPMFVWNGTDLDGEADIKAYELNITCWGGCSIDNRLLTITSGFPYITENHTLQDYLQYLIDDNYYYTWKVRANDSYGWGQWSPEWRLNISSLVDINMTTRTVNFGVLSQDATNDTTDGSPPPFVLENTGNCPVDVTINSTNLWQTVVNPSNYFRYKIDNVTLEPGSFNWALSKTSWVPVPNSSTLEKAIADFNWSDATDSAKIDINVTMPPVWDGGSGARSALVQFIASYRAQKGG